MRLLRTGKPDTGQYWGIYLRILGVSHLVCTVGVNTVDQIPICVLHVLEADIPKDTGVVEKHIDAAKVLNGRLDNRLAVLHAVVVGDRLTAGGADLIDDNICGLRRVSGMYPNGSGGSSYL